MIYDLLRNLDIDKFTREQEKTNKQTKINYGLSEL